MNMAPSTLSESVEYMRLIATDWGALTEDKKQVYIQDLWIWISSIAEICLIGKKTFLTQFIFGQIVANVQHL